MAHEIKVDSNTYVGYNFITKEYYVKNLDTKTTLHDQVEAKQILDVTAPFNNVSEEQIFNLSQVLEPLTSIQYAWEDTGKYIKAIYFNDYKDYAVVYNEPYLYIKGSVEMWDMSSSLSRETIRDFFWSYFRFNLGLNVSIETFNAIINYYNKIQSPYVYNNIIPREKTEDTLMYSNVLTVNNPDKSSRGEYTGTKNPDNVYSMDVYKVIRAGQVVENVTHNIHSMSIIGNIILLDSIVNDISVGDKITVVGTPNDKEYTALTVGTQDLLSGNTVTRITTEPFNNDYTSNMYSQGFVKLKATTTRNENSITLDTEPMVKSGDILQLRGDANINNLVVDRTEGSKIILKSSSNVDVHTEANNQLYASAYNITKIGYDDYTEVLGSIGVNKIVGETVYIADWLHADTLKVGQQIYLNYGGGLVKGPYNISTTNPNYVNKDTNKVDGGYITLNSSPGKDYTSTLGMEPVFIEVRNTTQIEEDSITVDLPINLDEDEVIEIKNSNGWDGSYTVDNIEIKSNNTKIWLKRDDAFQGFDKWYKVAEQSKKAVVQVRVYSERILLDMTYSKRADKMPTGKFMLDNDQQFTNYLSTYHIVAPTSANYSDINQPVSMKYFLEDGLPITTMNCVGLYSEIYKD